MNRQEIFNTVSRHLLSQREKSIDDKNNTCAYRGTGGLKCAIGCLIADEDYNKDLENRPVDDAMIKAILEKTLDINVHSTETMGLLWKLQRVHDDCDTKDWETELQGLANEFNLQFPEEIKTCQKP